MGNTGLGVMIGLLSGNGESARSFNLCRGKTISALKIGDDVLVFTFDDGAKLTLYDGGQSCCEHRYMNTDDNLYDFIGAKLLDAETRDGPEKDGNYGDVLESQFLLVTTSKGVFTVVNYNKHNGYYGGFLIQTSFMTDEPPIQ